MVTIGFFSGTPVRVQRSPSIPMSKAMVQPNQIFFRRFHRSRRLEIQSISVILTSVISNNRLSQRKKNLIHCLNTENKMLWLSGEIAPQLIDQWL